MRGPESQAPFLRDECRNYLDCLDRFRDPGPGIQPPTLSPSQSSAKTLLIAWILFNAGMYATLLNISSSFTLSPAQHQYKNDYGLTTRTSLPVSSHTNVVFKLISFFCFGAPTTHYGHIEASAKRAKLHGDIHIWPTYIQTLVSDWTTFNLAVSYYCTLSVSTAVLHWARRPLSCSRSSRCSFQRSHLLISIAEHQLDFFLYLEVLLLRRQLGSSPWC